RYQRSVDTDPVESEGPGESGGSLRGHGQGRCCDLEVLGRCEMRCVAGDNRGRFNLHPGCGKHMVDHSTKLQGLGGAQDAPPLILERTDQEFIPAILDELARERGLSTIPGSAARARDKRGVLTLFQPVHRTFNVALVEAACDTIGRPRLDPERIESAGLVIRRIASGPRGEKQLQGWRQKDRAVRGWVPFKNRKDEDLDPDPVRRRPELTAGHVEIDRRLATFVDSSGSYEESVAPLFVAPPDVCKAAGRTILYGVVPVTSSDMSEEARS